MRPIAVSVLLTNLRSLIGVKALLSVDETAAVVSFNRFGQLAWGRTAWPFVSRLTQVIPDVRVRSINVGSGGSSYSSAPTVAVVGAALQ